MKYFRMYQILFKLNFSNLVAYRGNFISSFISSMVWGIFSILLILLLTSQTSTIFGWNRAQLVLLTLGYNVIIGTFQVFFSDNFDKLSQTIHYAELDGILLKPVDSQFLATTKLINYTTFSRIILAIIVGGILIVRSHMPVTFLGVVLFVVFGIIGILLLYSFWMTVATLTIWFTRLSNLIDFLYQITGIARYPQEMSRQLPNFLAFVVAPLTLVVVVPIKLLLQRANSGDIIGVFFFSFVFFVFSRFFWRFALRYYTSASS